jgi:hypothetical protein
MKNMTAVLLACMVGAAFLGGCGGSSPTVRDVDRSVTVLEEVETLTENPLPEWTLVPDKYEHKKPDTEYFVGIGFPRQTRVFAMHSAAERAYANIAKYIGQIVAVKWQSAGEAKNLHGQQSIETVVEEFVQKTLAVARVKHARLVEAHIERVSARHRGTQVLLDRVYQLYAVKHADLAATAKASAKQVAKEIQQARDKVRKEQLEKLEKILKGLSAKDFEL